MKLKATLCWMFGGLFVAGAMNALSAEVPDIVITRPKDDLGFLKPVPVSISGFTGEADATLKNDLLFMGVINVPVEEAKYLVAGSNSGRVEGRVTDKTSKNQLFARAYTGGSTRVQIHAFADDLAKALTGLPGIAQTKVTFKAEAGLGRSEIYIADFDGHNPTQVTSDGTIVAAPCWLGKGADRKSVV